MATYTGKPSAQARSRAHSAAVAAIAAHSAAVATGDNTKRQDADKAHTAYLEAAQPYRRFILPN